jgi:peptidoglycan/xylan/chitin deacetylase (PgdA/CDA1 family)
VKEGAIKAWLFRAATELRLPSIVEAWARGVPILAYHGVTASPSSPLGNIRRLHVPAQRFEKHLRVLSAEWRPVPLSELVEAIEAGRRLPERSVVVTFDDGYRNILTTALPLLRKYSIPATLFVATHNARRMWEDDVEVAITLAQVESLRWNGDVHRLDTVEGKRRALLVILRGLQRLGPERERAIERLVVDLRMLSFPEDDDRDLLSWDELGVLQREGLEIGSHADRHGPLTERPVFEVRSALCKSLEELSSRFGPGRYPLAYPYGASSGAISTAARDAGFSCALIARPGLNSSSTDLFALKRFLIGADDDELRLRASLSGLRAFGRSGRAWGLR